MLRNLFKKRVKHPSFYELSQTNMHYVIRRMFNVAEGKWPTLMDVFHAVEKGYNPDQDFIFTEEDKGRISVHKKEQTAL
jgi:hypothetical protein